MIKVCHMTSAHNSQDVRILKKQCTSLAKKYETYLVAKGESYIENNVNVIGIGEISGGRLKRMTQAAKVIYKKALELDCDVYQIHDPELLPFALKLKKKGKKVIFDSHESVIDSIYEKEYIPKGIRAIIAKICGKYLKFVLTKIDATITVTPHIYDYYANFANNVEIITNFPIIEELPAKTNLGKNIIFAGGNTQQWNHATCINAIQDLKIEFIAYGKAENAYIQDLNSIDENRKFYYKGKVSHSEVGQKIRNSYIGIALLQKNRNAGGEIGTLGNTKIFEYMLAGIPLICTDFILWKEIIEKYETGIYQDPHDIEGLKRHIEYLIDNPDKALQMGLNGQKAIKEEYNWENEEKKLFKFYEEVIGQ